MGFRILLGITLIVAGTTAVTLQNLGKGTHSEPGGSGKTKQTWIPSDSKNALAFRYQVATKKQKSTSAPHAEVIPIVSTVLDRSTVPVSFNFVPIRQPPLSEGQQLISPSLQGWWVGPVVLTRFPIPPPEFFQPQYLAQGQIDMSNKIHQKAQNARPESWQQQSPENKGVADLFSTGMYAPMQLRLPFPPVGPSPYPLIFLVSRPAPLDLIQTESKEVQAQVPFIQDKLQLLSFAPSINVEQKQIPSRGSFRQEISPIQQKPDQLDVEDHLGIPKPTETTEEDGNKTDPTAPTNPIDFS